MIGSPWPRILALAAALLAPLLPGTAAEPSRPDPQGYLRDWLMLAPIPLPDQGAAGDLLLREQIKDEALLQPAPGETVTVGNRKLTWQRILASTNIVDLNALLKSQNDRAAGYLVAYVECEREIPDVVMAVASNDQGRIYFNGVDIYAFTEARPLMLDADKGRVTLKKGVNVIVFKIINEQNSWQGAMRLLDKSGAPLRGVKLRSHP